MNTSIRLAGPLALYFFCFCLLPWDFFLALCLPRVWRRIFSGCFLTYFLITTHYFMVSAAGTPRCCMYGVGMYDMCVSCALGGIAGHYDMIIEIAVLTVIRPRSGLKRKRTTVKTASCRCIKL